MWKLWSRTYRLGSYYIEKGHTREMKIDLTPEIGSKNVLSHCARIYPCSKKVMRMVKMKSKFMKK